eukprot:7169884-Karenia_brevis.AAC.1
MTITSPPDSKSDSEANRVHSQDYDAPMDVAIRILPDRRIVDPITRVGIWIIVNTACNSSCCGTAWRKRT